MPTANQSLSVTGPWTLDPLPLLAVGLAGIGYLLLARRVNRAHPLTPVPRLRILAWTAGLVSLVLALVSPIGAYADSVFTIHMVQHLLLAMVAPPLLAFGAPVTLALRAATPRLRRRVLLPLLHARLVRAVAWPPVGWLVFAGVMWFTHFSPLFNAALDDRFLHDAEHLLYLVAGALFWWPVIGADPGPWNLRPLARMAYLAGQMPFNAAVGLAIYFAPGVLYAHYARNSSAFGIDPLTDQQVAGTLMWGAGDLILLAALVLAAAAWLQAAERRSRRLERRTTQ